VAPNIFYLGRGWEGREGATSFFGRVHVDIGCVGTCHEREHPQDFIIWDISMGSPRVR
jgi:hypothetical protein